MTLPGSMAVARPTGGRTTKCGTFGYTKHGGSPMGPSPPLKERGEGAQAEKGTRLHILATATSKAASPWWPGEQTGGSPADLAVSALRGPNVRGKGRLARTRKTSP